MSKPFWPNGARCAVTLSFDLDGMSAWLNRGPEFADYPSILAMGEYGPKVGAPRILDVLDAANLKATFFVPGFEAELHGPLLRDMVARGHEVAHHGYKHEYVWLLTPEEERQALQRGIKAIEDAIGQKPFGWRAPGYEMSPRTLDLLAEHDFIYSSSQMGDDVPYFPSETYPRLVELPVAWMLDDYAYFMYLPMVKLQAPPASPDQVFSSWAAEFDGLYRFGRSFTITLHPEITGRPSRLRVLERLIDHIQSHSDVVFMRSIDLARFWLEQGKGEPAADRHQRK
jgi:peptidoglycan/xylan/chitin deacetylase (PgdA/CDA1 family)